MNTESENSEFHFTTIMPVRITDINYGMHLGHVALPGIFHNARVLFLNKNGFDEMNIEGCGLILLESNYKYKHEASFNTNLLVSVGIGEYTKLKFNFIYKAINNETGIEIANGQEEIACFDYQKRKIARIPTIFLDFCNKAQIKGVKEIINEN